MEKIKDNKKIIILILVLVLLVVGLFIFTNGSKKEKEEPKVPTKELIYEMMNENIEKEDGKVIFSAQVVNVTKEPRGETTVYLLVENIDKKELGRVQLTIPELKNGDNTKITADISNFYEGAYDYELEIPDVY